MALVVREGAGAVIRPQLAWGYGHENQWTWGGVWSWSGLTTPGRRLAGG